MLPLTQTLIPTPTPTLTLTLTITSMLDLDMVLALTMTDTLEHSYASYACLPYALWAFMDITLALMTLISGGRQLHDSP